MLQHNGYKSVCLIACLLLLLAPTPNVLAQTATGSILGTVTDPSGAVLPNATVVIKSVSTGSTRTLTTTEAGTYSAIALVPGDYRLTYQAAGFGDGEKVLSVTVGGTANGDFTLRPGQQTTAVQVTADSLAVSVDTVQAVVQDVITGSQIDNIPLNVRNFLDLAQLNVGVQIQDGGNLDPTKQGFAGISLQGRSGRATRIEVDGIDVTDDTVGTTTINLSEESIQEFQVTQANVDPANGVSSSGAVNVTTRAGSNDIHGSAFYLFRNNSLSAPLNGQNTPFDRSQVGWRAGGPVIKNKLFWFLNYEHTLQHGTTFAAAGAPFSAFSGAFSSPLHETEATGRLDWNLSAAWRAFYSFHFDQMNLVTGFGGISFQPFANRNYNSLNSWGLDGTTGKYTHSIRFGLLRYRNYITDARAEVPGLPSGFPAGVNAAIAIGTGSDPFCTSGTNLICLGPSFLVPQTTLQHNQQIRYDGSFPYHSHTFRYGAEFLNIPEAGFASFIGDGPILNALSSATPANVFPGGAANPLNYPLSAIAFGNGLGFSSEVGGLGFPHGAFPGKRLSFYAADYWKIKPNLTASLGLRYNRITGRTDSDARGLPTLDGLIPGADHAPNQPNLNFAPQVGIAWDPFKNGKTSVRAGAGIFFDNFLIENLIFDRPLRIPGGLANVTPVFTSGVLPGTTTDIATLVGQPIGSVVNQVVALQNAYQAFNAASASTFNANGTPGFNDPNVFNFNTIEGVLAPNLKIPRSFSLNIGVQRQLTPTLFLSVDYIRNVNTHSLVNYDVNDVGAASTLNVPAANAAIAATESQFGCANIQCTIANGATIQSFSANGLGSPANGELVQSVPPAAPGAVPHFAFPGRDPQLGQIMLSNTIGRSVYNALQIRLKQDIAHPFRGVRRLSLTANYNLSRFDSTQPDQDVVFNQNAKDNLNPLSYFGPNSLDRTNIFSFSSTWELWGGLRLSAITRINTGLSTTLTLPLHCACPAEIFYSDLTGDGTGGDVLPGTNLGSFGRTVKASDLNNVIGKFNSTTAGNLTPAGQALVAAGLFSASQLQQLGAVVPSIPLAPRGGIGLDNFVADDIRLSYSLRLGRIWKGLGENSLLEPTFDLYNVANKANFDPPAGFITSPLLGSLSGAVGSVNGTTGATRPPADRYGFGTGVFSQGVPRALEIGMRLTF
jgi:Carboxypeptidase regulatory-like domain